MGIDTRYSVVDCCRISSSRQLDSVLDLGKQPLANSLKNDAVNRESLFPLTLSYCSHSSLLQLNETVDKGILFDNYVWVTGTSEVARTYANQFANRVLDISGLDPDDLVVEIASNDGTFLKSFVDMSYPNVLGVDPAVNVAEIANKQGVRTLPEYWTGALAQDLILQYGKAKVVIARNVMPHVSELLDVMTGIELILSKDGVLVIEFHDAARIQTELHYDSIYHEHLCYYSIQSMIYLLNKFDLIPFHIEKSPISGGSWVIYSSKNSRGPSDALDKAILDENENMVNSLTSWLEFAKRVKRHRQQTLQILNTLNGKNILGFGASARSQTYLNYCGIDKEQVNAIIDNSPLKHNLFAPGSSIPIVGFNEGMEMNPDIIFVLAWNFRDEIISQCKSYGYKGQFLVPFPNTPHIIN